MAKPTTKEELINQATEKFNQLQLFIEQTGEQDFCFDAKALTLKDNAAHWMRDRNLKDVIMHLYEWHQLLIEWEEKNSKGINKKFLVDGYTWATYKDMNIEFWKKNKDVELSEAISLLKKSHEEVMNIISKYTTEELYTKSYFSWTNTTTLAQYCLSGTASHYDWAIKKLKINLKAKNKVKI